MRTRLFLAAVVVSALVTAGVLRAADEKDLKDVKCPVSGKAVKADKTVEFNDGKVYFCCDGCPKAFEANKEKFAAKANHQLAQTEQIEQVACPLSGRDTKEGTEVEVDGVKVAFCCNNCKGKVAKASDEEKLTLVFKDISKSFKAKEAKK